MKMRKFQQNKLWRDKLPEKMAFMGSIIHIKELNDTEFDQELRLKLSEEVEEVQSAKTKEDLAAEIADVLEVIDTLCKLNDLSAAQIQAVKEKKRIERGGFEERAFVTIAEHPEGSFGEHYCLAQPEKYPEVL